MFHLSVSPSSFWVITKVAGINIAEIQFSVDAANAKKYLKNPTLLDEADLAIPCGPKCSSNADKEEDFVGWK